MKMHTVTTYSFSELSDKAKENAIDRFRQYPDLYAWGDENVQSLQAFCEHFRLSGLDYEVSTCSYSYASASAPDEIAELKGVRLWKYLTNSGLLTIHKEGKQAPLLDGECPFTGYCFDEVLLDPVRAFMNRPGKSVTYQDLMDDCLNAWVSAYVKEWEYAYSDEAITETIEANEYEFTENGKLY